MKLLAISGFQGTVKFMWSGSHRMTISGLGDYIDKENGVSGRSPREGSQEGAAKDSGDWGFIPNSGKESRGGKAGL